MVNRDIQDLLGQVFAKKRSGDDAQVSSLYFLIKELHCLSDVVGRTYEVKWDENKFSGRLLNKLLGRTQLKFDGVPASTINELMSEVSEDYARQKKEMDKAKRRR